MTRESVDAQLYQCSKSDAYVGKRGGGGAGNPVVAACCVWSCIISCNPILLSAVHTHTQYIYKHIEVRLLPREVKTKGRQQVGQTV